MRLSNTENHKLKINRPVCLFISRLYGVPEVVRNVIARLDWNR